MSIKARFALLLGVLAVTFLAALRILQQSERTQAEALLKESLQTRQMLLQRWIELTNQPLQRFGQDYGQWTEMAEFISRPDPAWARTNLEQNLANYETHALWVLDPQGQVVYSTQQNAGPSLPPPCDSSGFARLAATPGAGRHFFAESRDGLMEIWNEPVGSGTTAAVASGWLMVARLWDTRFLATLGRLAEASLQLAPLEGSSAIEHSYAQLLLPLKNLEGVPLRLLQARIPPPDFTETLARDTRAARLFIFFALLVIVAVWLGVRQWVLRPLGRITESLAREDASLIRPLQHEKTELGRVACLVESSFAQKSALQHEIEERKRAEETLQKSEQLVRRSLELRARLARDLHDGVIQSIYAAGLGLETAGSQFDHDPSGARTRLQHCRQSLNDIIREIRGFINGLEPEQMPRQGFAEELAALARTMQALWPARIILQVDQQASNQLRAGQEIHSLQIVRECISNALRHGGAKEIRIALDQAGGNMILTVHDDGRGFEPEKQAGRGSGLLNLSSRAREMGGTLQLDSQPGRGAVVIVTFPLAVSPA